MPGPYLARRRGRSRPPRALQNTLLMDLLSQPPLEGVAVTAKAFVRDLVDGQLVESPFLVRDRTRREKRNGDAFLKLQLGDVTGAVEAVVWDGVDEAQAGGAGGGGGVVAGGSE